MVVGRMARPWSASATTNSSAVWGPVARSVLSTRAAVGGQPRLPVTLEAEQQFGRLPVEGEQGGAILPGGSGQAGSQSV